MPIPLLPSYTATVPDGNILGIVRYARRIESAARPPALTVAAPALNSDSIEVWSSRESVVYGRRGCIVFSHDDHVLYGAITAPSGEIEPLARQAYTAILDTIRAEGFAHLLRVWNYVRDINGGVGEHERYKRFCAGRHQALCAGGIGKQQFAAASAVGMLDGELAVHFIAGREPGRQVENARQVSAYDYPPRYGRRPPSFSRATVVPFGRESLVFISGTASIVGHETRHREDVLAQTDETLANLAVIAQACGSSLTDLQRVKVYVRRPQDAPGVSSRLRAAMPQASLIALQADICRADLLLEVEALATLSDRAADLDALVGSDRQDDGLRR